MKKIFFVAFLFITQFAFSQNFQPANTDFVADSANTLTSDQVSALNQSILSIAQQTSVQLAIVLIDSVPRGMNVGQLSEYVARKYQGSDINANVLVYVASISHHLHRLTSVSGVIAGRFDRQKCANILITMKPDYNAKNYYAGMQLMVNTIASTLGVTVQPVQKYSVWRIISIVLIVIIILVIAIIILKKDEKKTAQPS